MASHNLFFPRIQRKRCASCHIELRNPSNLLCDICHTLCGAMQANLPYWLAAQQLEDDAREAQVNEKRRLMQDEGFQWGPQ